MASNDLISDAFVDFVLDDLLGVEKLCELPFFADHSRDTLGLYVDSARKVARRDLYPSYRTCDQEPPRLVSGRVRTHASLHVPFRRLVELGVINATRPAEVGGQQLPLTVASLANAYLMAANLSAYGYVGLTTGAAHLIEAFGSDALKQTYMAPLYAGTWTGTMALTEPHAGSSLADVTTTAEPTEHDYYRVRGSKIFISGGDHDLTPNVVNLTLARIAGAPEGTRGLSLFVIPRSRPEGDQWVDNDVQVAGLIHKIGWKALPSLALNFGEQDDCRGWLVGEPHQGLRYMFQMMNEARLMVGLNGAATASVAYRESLAYAQERKQGRAPGQRGGDPVAIIEHADVRRMLLRQKVIVEGSLALLAKTSYYADLAEHSTDPREREESKLLLDLLTPIAKTFPAEQGYEANVLAVQIHGGYGYTSEYLPEAWMRDQKLNSIHEGTTGIQGLDLLGRRVMAQKGSPLQLLGRELHRTVERAQAAGLERAWGDQVLDVLATTGSVTQQLGARGQQGRLQEMLAPSAAYLELFSVLVVGWIWLEIAAACREGQHDTTAFGRGLQHAAAFYMQSELPRASVLAQQCLEPPVYAAMPIEDFI